MSLLTDVALAIQTSSYFARYSTPYFQDLSIDKFTHLRKSAKSYATRYFQEKNAPKKFTLK